MFPIQRLAARGHPQLRRMVDILTNSDLIYPLLPLPIEIEGQIMPESGVGRQKSTESMTSAFRELFCWHSRR